MTALVQTRPRQGRPADPQRHPRGLRPRRPHARRLVLDHRLRRPRARPPARSSATASTRRYDGKAEVIFAESAPGTAGKEELESAVKEALAAGPPPTPRSSPTITVSDRTAAQTDVGNALQGNPDVTAVFGQNDEGALGAIGAFKAAGKELPCITEAGGNEEALAAAKAGEIYAVVALQFAADMAQSFDALTDDDRRPGGRRRAADRPAGSREGGRLTIDDELRSERPR